MDDKVYAKLSRRIGLQGLEMVMVGALAFGIIIGAMMVAYRLFIMERVKGSDEFRAASYFAVNSLTLKEKLLSPVEALNFHDIEVSENRDYGVCEIYFELVLKDGIRQTLRVGLVKVADFWLVYSAVLDPGLPAEKALASTYQKILVMLEKLDFEEVDEARSVFELIKTEVRDAAIEDYLAIKLGMLEGNTVYALQLAGDLADRTAASRLAVMSDHALLYYQRGEFAQSIKVMEDIEREYVKLQPDDNDVPYRGLFADLPKDPFIAGLDPDNVVANSRKLLSLAHHDMGNYAKGLQWAERAIEQAEKIQSSVVRSASVYLKALNLYSLERYADADREFSNVISDIDNPNLAQKAWAAYFKADIAARFSRHADALDYYEMAVSLDPANVMARRGAIEYLMSRNYVGDLEIALGIALRGIDFGAGKDVFKDFAQRLYARLGLPDKTKNME